MKKNIELATWLPVILSGMALILFSAMPANSATDEEFEDFRQAMLERDCWFRDNDEGKALQKDLGMTNSKFSEVMLRLALNGEFICPGGCKLLHPECPKPE